MSEQTDKRPDAGLATAFSMGPVILAITRLADVRFAVSPESGGSSFTIRLPATQI